MDPTSSLPLISMLVVAIATTFLFMKTMGAPSDQNRFSSIDGLRGYLAFFVFVHHASFWYFYLQSGVWSEPPSLLYTNIGQASVVFFFMITGFLFFTKILDSRHKGMDWTKLFVSRAMRLTPLYLFAMAVFLTIIAILSDWKLNEPLSAVLIGVARWVGFAAFGKPDINGIENTFTIIAGVPWTLRHEWFFYFSLPALACLVGLRPPRFFLMLSVLGLLGPFLWHPRTLHWFSFVCGISTAVVVRYDLFRQGAVTRTASLVAMACIGAAIFLFPSAYKQFSSIFLLFMAFAIFAGGNNLFGLLSHPVSRTLGEVTYSIYLLHGLVLFVLFRFVIGMEASRALSPTMFWACVTAVTPILIATCFVTFRFIEYPAMHSTTRITAWLRSRARTNGMLPARPLAPASDGK
ncbi:acyltransferase [Uliginosibacterium sp. H3]|uniref:Acyltransferase n=1 Tax=Uliginosibacterium silvisoli TaxID=3114758 RepID=A0ABU6K865_9RHOO|nr:acyltransferase [Uliginosibacterium sp. H3]